MKLTGSNRVVWAHTDAHGGEAAIIHVGADLYELRAQDGPSSAISVQLDVEQLGRLFHDLVTEANR